MKNFFTLITVLFVSQAAFAQSLPDPVWPMTLAEFNAQMQDPNTNSVEKIEIWQNFEASADYNAALAVTHLAQSTNQELADMATAVQSLASAVAAQSATQASMAAAIRDLVTFQRIKLHPSRVPAAFPINVNTASPEELMDVPGIGPSLAVFINNFTKTTQFGAVGDMILLPGMTNGLLRQITPFVTVGP